MPRKKPNVKQLTAVARINAMKHGFATRSPVIPMVEDEADWKRHLRGMQKSLAPEGYFEEFLVRRLATALWELDRLTAYNVAETMHTISSVMKRVGFADNLYRGDKEFTEPDPLEYEEIMHRILLPDNNTLEVIMRFGGQLHRQWIQLHNQLLAVQARRRGEKVQLAMVDIIGAPPNLGPFRSTPPPEAQFAKEANARISNTEHALAERKRAYSTLPDFLAKDA